MSVIPHSIEIYADSRGEGTCNGKHCGQKILWATIVKSGKKMCFNDLELPALRTYHEPATDRLIEVVDRDDTHWATCPDSKRF